VKEMKKLIPLLLCLTLLLAGCADRHSAEVCIDGYTLTVNTQYKTVTYGEDVYFYENNEKNVIENTVTVRYPNGASYEISSSYAIIIQGGSVSDIVNSEDGTYTGQVDLDRYIAGKTLANAALRGMSLVKEAEEERTMDIVHMIGAAVLLLAAFVNVRYADDLWYLRHHWHVSGGEPTEFYYDRCKLTAALSVIAAVVLLIMVIF
jgi:hypothetical protein